MPLINHACSDTEAQLRRQRQWQLPSHLSDFVITKTIGTSLLTSELFSERFKNNLYYPTIDNILKEMKTQFSDINLTLMKCIDSLHPQPQHFLEADLLRKLLKQYKLPFDGLEEQVFTFKMYLEKLPFRGDTNKLCDLLEALLPVETAFPTIKKAIVIAITFGTSTATVEHSFSALKIILNRLSSTMNQTRLDDLTLLHIESDLAARL